MRYKDKKIAVLGFGESGEAAAALLAAEGAKVTVLDSALEERLGAKVGLMRSRGVAVVAGVEAEQHRGHYDLAVLSPGIDPSAALVQSFIRQQIEIIGELEMSFDLCACPVIAITGTNGKTTTTELVAGMLSGCGVRTLACGNIGPSFAATVAGSSELDVMTVEVSSFQLERIRHFRPRVSVWLNFAPDHLDRYATLKEYKEAKLRIFENQTTEDFAVVNLRDELPSLRAKKITFSAYEKGGDFDFEAGVIRHLGTPVLSMDQTKLRGLHNAENLMAAMGVGLARGLPLEAMAASLAEYKPLPHRCELVRQLRGVDYVNDSKATNLDALEKALLSESRPVVLIAGGKDKGFDFGSQTSLVAEKARAAILLGQMAPRIQAEWKDTVHCIMAGSLAEAVEMSAAAAHPGDVVLFSPGTSSFDMFKNYADRGNQFRAAVQTLK